MNMLAMLAFSLLLVVLAAAWFTWRTARRIEAYLPPAGQFIDVPGARLHIRDEGGGPPLLLIHGMAGQLGHYGYGVIERLTREYRVVAVDRPGCGYSTRDPGRPADLSTQAAAFAALIDKLQLGRPVVVGHSLGGAVALALALEHPERVAGLALIAPLTHLQDEVPPVFRPLAIRPRLARQLVAWTVAAPASIVRTNAVLREVFGPETAPPDFATRGGGLHSLRPSQFLTASDDLQALPQPIAALQARYAELKLPVRVLYARDDQLLDWKEHGQALVDKVPGATLKLVEGGHMLPITQPDQTAAFVREVAQECRR